MAKTRCEKGNPNSPAWANRPELVATGHIQSARFSRTFSGTATKSYKSSCSRLYSSFRKRCFGVNLTSRWLLFKEWSVCRLKTSVTVQQKGQELNLISSCPKQCQKVFWELTNTHQIYVVESQLSSIFLRNKSGQLWRRSLPIISTKPTSSSMLNLWKTTRPA